MIRGFGKFVFLVFLLLAHGSVADEVPLEEALSTDKAGVSSLGVQGANSKDKKAQNGIEPDPYIKSVPKDRPLRIVVLGDSLGVGAWQGLYQNFKQDPVQTVEVVQEAQVNTGIVRSDRLNWPEKVKELAARNDFEMAVFLFGGNDMQSIRLKGKAHHYKTDGWLEHYGQRIDAMIGAMKDQDVAVYWIGLPNVARKRLAEDYQYINTIFQQKVEEHGVRFADTWEITSGEDGNYLQFGDDLDGRKTKLRARDGVHFTPSGYRMLAHPVEKLIRKDLREIGVDGSALPPQDAPFPKAKDEKNQT